MDDYNQTGASDQDKHRKRNDLQREIIMAEADLRKVSNEKITIDAEIRRLKSEMDHLKIDMQAKVQRLHAVDQDIIMRQAEISHLKKQINLI